MNTHRTNHGKDDGFLDNAIDAAREAHTANEVGEVAARFRASLPKREKPRVRRFVRWAGAGIAAALVLTVAPQLIPGNNGTAFAAVQAWLESYRTVHVQTVTRHGGETLTRMDIWATADGAMRLESGPVTHIVNTNSGTMHTLLPGNQVMTVPVETGNAPETGAAMKWIREIRRFQGQAEALPENRTIDGMEVTGYRLTIEGTTVDLWAETGTGKPVLMEVVLSDEMVMENRFAFDQPLPDDAFSVPAGYRPVEADEG